MLAATLEKILSNTAAGVVTEVFSLAIVAVFFVSIYLSTKNIKREFVDTVPTLLTSLGILGTFVGIVIGLLSFDVANIDKSIEGLLGGLKTAFITSLLGMASSIIFKMLLTSRRMRGESKETVVLAGVGPEQILEAINLQKTSIDGLKHAIVGDDESAFIGQFKLMRSDLNDHHKMALKNQESTNEKITATNESLVNIATSIKEQQESFNNFSDKLWIKMQNFSDMLSKSATETVIEALKQVITDFNNNLTEQFGENFKQLNESVKELVVWQDNYKHQIHDMTEQYKLSVSAIEASETSITNISNESKVIPETMNNLKDVMEVNQHQLKELESHLEAFKDMRDRAVEAVPEIRSQIDETVKTIQESVSKANEHYEKLLSESDNYIDKHIKTSNELLEKFVTNTKEGVESIGEKLSSSAERVEKAMVDGATEFSESVHSTNTSLQSTADHVGKQTDVIKDHLEDTVKDLNNHVRNMIEDLVRDSKEITSNLKEANATLTQDTGKVRDGVVKSINTMQSRLESALDEIFKAQTTEISRTFGTLENEIEKRVGSTGQAIEGQVKILDKAMEQEVERAISNMGNALAQVTGKFTDDYTRLVNAMGEVVRRNAA